MGLREDWEENNGGCRRVRSEMRRAAAGLCLVELEMTMGKWFCFVVCEAGLGYSTVGGFVGANRGEGRSVLVGGGSGDFQEMEMRAVC